MKFSKIDYERHFWSGALIAFGAFFICEFVFSLPIPWCLIFSMTTSVLAGYGKELYDKHIKKTKFDWQDFKFTVLGGLAMTGFFALITVVIPALLN